MYYIAGVTEDGTELGCDFGFDMIERILLDEVFLDLPPGLGAQLVAGKRFSYFGDKPGPARDKLVGHRAQALQNRFNLVVARDYCRATVINRSVLLPALKRALIKLTNMPRWACNKIYRQPHLFKDVVVYSPYLLRLMLGREKYGDWDHARDRERALEVCKKFISFMYDRDYLRDIIIYNELLCPHWDATGEMHFDARGVLTDFNYFGRGYGHSYRFYPELKVWHRK